MRATISLKGCRKKIGGARFGGESRCDRALVFSALSSFTTNDVTEENKKQ